MSRHTPTVEELLAEAKKGELRDLTATQTVTLPNGQQHSYAIKTDNDSPAEIAAFERLEAKKQAELAAFVQGHQEKPIDVPEGMVRYPEQEKLVMPFVPSCAHRWHAELHKSSPVPRPLQPEQRLMNCAVKIERNWSNEFWHGGLKSEVQHLTPGKVHTCRTRLSTANSNLKTE